MMELKRIIPVIFIFALFVTACEDVSEPFSIEDGAVPAYVIISTADGNVLAGGSLTVTFQLPQTQEEDVIVEYEVSGDAVPGEDYVMTGGEDGTVTIVHNPDNQQFDVGTIQLEFPITAALGTARNLTFTLVSATTASGEELTVGRASVGLSRTYTINGLGSMETGTYSYTTAGSFGDRPGSMVISQPEEPIIVDGEPYLFETSDIAALLFGSAMPYAFNLTADGTVIGAPFSHVASTVILDVGGSYDEDTNTIVFDIVFQCCGVVGAELVITGTLDD